MKNGVALDALAYAALPERALVARLASLKVGKYFTMEESKRLIRSIYPKHGDLLRLAQLVYDEVQRQTPIRNGRRAHALTMKVQAGGTMQLIKRNAAGWHRARQLMKTHHGVTHFADYINESFCEEVLALLEAMGGGPRSYAVQWLDTGCRPCIASVVRITSGEGHHNILVYKVRGKGVIRSALTKADTVRDAFADQVPADALKLAADGYTFRTDFDEQTLIATKGDDEKVFPWNGSLDI